MILNNVRQPRDGPCSEQNAVCVIVKVAAKMAAKLAACSKIATEDCCGDGRGLL